MMQRLARVGRILPGTRFGHGTGTAALLSCCTARGLMPSPFFPPRLQQSGRHGPRKACTYLFKTPRRNAELACAAFCCAKPGDGPRRLAMPSGSSRQCWHFSAAARRPHTNSPRWRGKRYFVYIHRVPQPAVALWIQLRTCRGLRIGALRSVPVLRVVRCPSAPPHRSGRSDKHAVTPARFRPPATRCDLPCCVVIDLRLGGRSPQAWIRQEAFAPFPRAQQSARATPQERSGCFVGPSLRPMWRSSGALHAAARAVRLVLRWFGAWSELAAWGQSSATLRTKHRCRCR